MAEKDVARKLAMNCPGMFWRPLSDKYGEGIPDRCTLFRNSPRTLLVELKYLEKLPLKHCKVGLKPRQAQWLTEWERNGGECYLIVGVGRDKVCIFTTDFIRICRDGVSRTELNLVDYSEVERVLWHRSERRTKET